MTATLPKITSKQLMALKARIDEWRETRDKVGPMPKALWLESVLLAEKIGVGETSRGLGLGYTNLKSKISRWQAEAHAEQVNDQFVDVTAMTASVDFLERGVNIELVRGDGGRMQVTNADTNCALQVAMVFLGGVL